MIRGETGRPVGGLRAEDFVILDNGKRQTLISFRVITAGHAVPLREARHAADTMPGTAVQKAAETPNTTASGRSIAYVFDDLDTGFTEFARTREAAIRHFQSALPPGEQAAIYTFSGRTSIPFTSDREKLEGAAKSLRVSLKVGHGDANPCPYVPYYLADLVVRRDDGRALEALTQQTMDCTLLSHETSRNMAQAAARREVDIGAQDVRVWAATLRRVIRLLEVRPGPRNLVLASSGVYSHTPEGTRTVAGVLDLAARANVTISSLHARGVYTMASADASRHLAPSGLEQQYYRDSAFVEENTLTDLAKGTGGADYAHNNDLAGGFDKLAAPPEYSYVLGFSPAPLKEDGSFHGLKIRLVGHAGMSIEARPGYYAPQAAGKGIAPEQVAEAVDDAVYGSDETTSIPLDAAAAVSRSGTAPAKLSIVSKIHVKPLRFQKLSGRNHALLTVAVVVFDEGGSYVVGSRNTVNLMLRSTTLSGNEDPAVNVQSNFEIPPGSYRVRVVVAGSDGPELSTRNIAVTVR